MCGLHRGRSRLGVGFLGFVARFITPVTTAPPFAVPATGSRAVGAGGGTGLHGALGVDSGGVLSAFGRRGGGGHVV